MRHIHTIGVDVSDSSIKVLELDAQAGIVAFGTTSLPTGVVHNGSILNKEAFADALVSVLQNTKPKVLYSDAVILRAVLCLPETKLFTHHLQIPEEVSKAEEESYIQNDAEKIVPYPVADLYWDYHTTHTDKVRTATFVGVPKSDLDAYVEAFSYAKIQPSFVGSELFSLGRALLPTIALEENYMIVDLGAHTTTIGMFGEDAIANVSIVIPRGGEFLTQVIVDELGMQKEKAEEEKRTYGVDDSHTHTRVVALLQEHVSVITEQINEAKVYFEKKTQKQLKHIILAGGTALMPGILTFVQKMTGIETSLADPLQYIQNHTAFDEHTPQVLFSTVIGLALLAHSDAPQINLLSLYRFEKGEHEKEMINFKEIRTWGDLYYTIFTYTQLIKNKTVSFVLGMRIPKKHTIQLAGSLIFLCITLVFLLWVIMQYM